MPPYVIHKEAEFHHRLPHCGVKLWHLTIVAGCRAVSGLVPRALFMVMVFKIYYPQLKAACNPTSAAKSFHVVPISILHVGRQFCIGQIPLH